ncbi:hypothetical protein [Actinocorallia longicatena]|uniref:Uncharacterized protein n=1 Tax=Actinocorallia longicatena TaxID=111803 RepID=A0ABP6Q4M4_9ACTN
MMVIAQELNNDTVSPGLLGTFVVVCMGVALVFLIRSMNKRIARIDAPRQADLDQAAWEAAEAEKATKQTDQP